MTVTKINSEAEFDETLQKAKDNGQLVVVDFSASWCGPCRMIEPRIVALSEVYTQVVFLKVDVDEVAPLAARCGISAMPTFFFYKAAQKVGEVVGANEEAVKNMIEKNL